MSNPYVPLLFLLAIGGGFAVFSVGAAAVSGPKRYNRAKLDAYECGIEPTPQAAGGGRVPIKYYLTAMLFIIFDIESVFLYPVRGGLQPARPVRARGDGAVHPDRVRGLRLRVAPRRPRVGLTRD